MGTSRRKFTSEFKKKVVLEALKERQTIQELANRYEVHHSNAKWATNSGYDSNERSYYLY
jgi:transposase-like protein